LNPQTAPGKGASTGSLVCGIIGLLTALFQGVNGEVLANRGVSGAIAYMSGYFAIPATLCIIALVQGTKAKKKGYPGGKATAGIVLGSIGAGIVILKMCAGLLLIVVSQASF
jgi:hypothetical protein